MFVRGSLCKFYHMQGSVFGIPPICPSIRLPVHPSNRPPVRPFVRSIIRLSVRLFFPGLICPFVDPSDHRFIRHSFRPSVCWSVYTSVCKFACARLSAVHVCMRPLVCPSMFACVRLSVRPCLHASACLSVHVCMRPLVCPSVRPCLHASACL